MKTLIRAIAIAALGLFAATAKADLYTLNDNEDWSGHTQDLPTMVDLNGHMLTIDGAAFSSTRFTATSDSQSVLRVSVDEGQSATVKSDALSGNLKLVKIGSGRLIVPPLRIETECLQGELGVKGVYPVVTGKPIHRWSFTGGSLEDSAGGSTATLVGAKSDEVTFADNAVTFPGGNNGECYLDMGAGMIPESGEVTIEIWGAQNQVKDWSRIWCVGVDGKNFLSMAWSNGGKVNSDFVQLKENNSDHFFATTTMAPYDVGTRFHISMRIFPSADGKTKFEWAKRDVSTGEILKSGSGETKSVWSLANFADRHFWLNHGFDNSDASATYDEVRIWNWALSDQELTDNVTAGPDVVLEREKEVVVEEKVEEPEAPVVLHRWSFTGGSLNDSVGGSTAALVGAKSSEVTFANNTVTFPGGGNGECCLDMGAGVIPESGEVTIEVWCTQNETKDWSRIWCVGRDNNNFLSMFWTWNGNVNNDFIQLADNKSKLIQMGPCLAPYTVGTQFHISMKIFSVADGKTKLEWAKRDVSTGQVLKSGSAETSSPWSLANIANCHFWLNHGFDNSDASASYDEVRIWKGALSDEQLNWNAWMGPDTIVIASANKRVCETLDIATGAMLSTSPSGATSFCNRLMGSGTLAANSTFVVEQKLDIAGDGFGVFTVDGSLKVAGDWILSCGAAGASDRVVGAGRLDLSDTVLVPHFASNSSGSYLVAKGVMSVGYQNLVLPPRYWLDVVGDKLYFRRMGFYLFVH